MAFLKILMLASTTAIVYCAYRLTNDEFFPPAAMFLVAPFILFAVAQGRNFIRCTECGISPDEEGFDDPDRELPFKFDYSKMGTDIESKKYLRQLKWGAGTCAACTKRVRELTKPRGGISVTLISKHVPGYSTNGNVLIQT